MPKDESKKAPVPIVHLDLDKLPNDGPGPFTVELGGRAYTLRDITQLDYRVALEAQKAIGTGDLNAAIKLVFADDDLEDFLSRSMSGAQLKALFEGYAKHYASALGHGR